MSHRREPRRSSIIPLASQVQKYRKLRGMTQEELAEALGVSHQSISKWESGQAMPGLDRILLLSEFFQISTDALLKTEGKSESPPGTASPSLPHIEERPARHESAWPFIVALTIAVAGLLGLGALWAMSLLRPPYTLGKTLGPIDMFLFYVRYNEIEPLIALTTSAILAGAGGMVWHRLLRRRTT